MNAFSSYAALLLRLAVGGVFLRHGITKVEGGIPALTGFLHGLGFPFANIWAVVLIVVETVGAGFVLLGVLTRAWAVCFVVEMIVAILRVQIPAGRNFELEALLLAGAASLVALGDGPLALGVKLKRGA
ncbi:MAG TPA: DoxX family protein [Gemmatimonadales bacterium]|nr:DoxX family protein [Gemmatimonadales bacterium]